MPDDEVAISTAVTVSQSERKSAVDTEAGAVRSMPTSAVVLFSGLLHDWQVRNRASTIPHAIGQLREAGNLDNLRAVLEPSRGEYRGRFPFLDTDVYKTLEGLAYEIGRGAADAEAEAFFDEAVDLLQSVQREDGYIGSFYQSATMDKQPWEDLAWGHELYNLGHLIQAAVAASRQMGDDRLLRIARAFADLAVRRFGEHGEAAICGHPEVEMALVELYRETGEGSYLTLAKLFIDRRGHGTIALSVFPAEYFQDNLPLRELPSVTGHAVRMAYLTAGATDLAIETDDRPLADAMERLWNDMVASKLYVTGGLGSRHSDEAIGDRYELPSERSYSETCAAIATMQWAWRMFLATGDAPYLDTFETVLYNAYAVGLSADGRAFFYDNPLQRRSDHQQRTGAEPDGELLRRAWFVCPCCPPNIIRWMSELQDYLAAQTDDTLYLAQFAGMSISHSRLDVTVTTRYPWDGAISIEVDRAEDVEFTLALRRPTWCREARILVNAEVQDVAVSDGWLRITRRWSAGDRIDLDLHMPVRAHTSHPYVDATRGALSIARGPLVYCAEQQDNDANIDDLIVEAGDIPAASISTRQLSTHAPADSTVITLPAIAAPASDMPLYPEIDASTSSVAGSGHAASVTLVPYFLWGNREAEAMRVWLRRQ